MDGTRSPASGLDPEILRYYAAGPESERLRQGAFQLERARTEELLLRHLPPPHARVLDVGGGSGPYACWLAERRYEVTLLDPVPLHVEQASRAAAVLPAGAVLRAQQGDARNLPVPDGSHDAVLMLGPLYHLTERPDRLCALREARRVLRGGGVACVVAISRFASLLAGLTRGEDEDPAFAAIVERDLREGQHRNRTSRVDWFTTAFFHRPDELQSEIEESGLALVALYGIEGPAWLASDFDRRWADEARRQRLLDSARAVEREPWLLGVSPHILAVTVRPVSGDGP